MKIEKAAATVCELLELADQRALAADGPVGDGSDCFNELGDAEKRRFYLAAHALARQLNATGELVEAARELRAWGVEHDDERLSYVTVQVNRADIAALDAALRAFEGFEGE